KLIVWGTDREAALARGARALGELEVIGVPTTTAFHRLAVRHPQFVAAEHATTSVETEWDLSGIPSFDDHHDTTPEVHVMPEGRTTSSRMVSLAVDGRVLDVTVHGMHAPGSAAARASATRTGGTRSGGRAVVDDGPEVRSPMQASVVSVEVEPGDSVEEGTLLCVLEAMKMEHRITARRAGVVAAVHVTVGAGVERSVTLVTIADA
ncbi:MAG: acetyl-/propionyl-CoA carboxylase subunit alpha, partial [Actinomycetota bacterium]|nr:acetyl-/propionyl-CoA carboxylase subunit alpha [Actinomycetota bacterium]